MHLGLNATDAIKPEDWPLIEDLGVTWLKSGWLLDRHSPDVLRKQLEQAREHDCRPVVDLRLIPTRYGEIYKEACARLYPDEGKDVVTGCEEGRVAIDVETLQVRGRRVWTDTVSTVGEWIYQAVERNRDLCQDWEIQGEFSCPVVTGNIFANFDYSLLIAAAGDAVRQADPSARVWTGGNGVWLTIEWFEHLLAEWKQPRYCYWLKDPEGGVQQRTLTKEAGDALLAEGWELARPDREPAPVFTWFREGVRDSWDVANWHHFGHTVLPVTGAPAELTLEEQLAAYDRLFGRAQEAMVEAEVEKPFASSEWGLPIAAFDDPHKVKASQVYLGGIAAVPEAASGDWYEACLGNFRKWGFRVVCIHNLHETDDPGAPETGRALEFWGFFCGLRDLDNKPRPSWDVVQRWAWEARESGEEAFGSTEEDN